MAPAPASVARGGGGGTLPKIVRVLAVAILYSLAMYRAASIAFGDAFSAASAGADPPQSSAAGAGPAGRGIGGRVSTAMIVATVPYDEVHARALWSHLECLTGGIDRVLIAAPDAIWSKVVVESIKDEFVRSVTRARSSNSSRFDRVPFVEAGYYRNNRYDAGLWCDGLRLGYGYDGGAGGTDDADSNATIAGGARKTDKPPVDPIADAIYIVNDSAMSMQRYDKLTRRIVVSTTHELYSPNFKPSKEHPRLVSLNGRFDDLESARPSPKYNWVESVYRGMTPRGLESFYRHTCLPESSRSCLGKKGDHRKRCIVDYFEKDLATSAYDIQTEVDAMYPSYWPNATGTFRSFGPGWNGTAEYERQLLKDWGDTKKKGIWPGDQWINSGRFFKYLRAEWGFPFKKVKRLKKEVTRCNSLVEKGFFQSLPYPDAGSLAAYAKEMAESESGLRSDEERERMRADEEARSALLSALGPEKTALLEKWCGGCRYKVWKCDQRVQFLETNYGSKAIETKLELLEGGHCGAEREEKDVEAEVAAENGVEPLVAIDPPTKSEVVKLVENGVEMKVAVNGTDVRDH